ncbi:MAG TPA: hypothetical protein PLS00_18655 [Niabella sp.]|uniref:hypothetical protein n=1 Tax=Agriterribacter sp. TaxID=2821509 RepID=UPI002C218023|nr:hypothetical protein [Agriterribacter sp.]HRO46449.1 hypothetical protein [Agriterribacter sp.]HRQ17348.1 hypothetical protein [Agriterribacter sp.]HUN04872.1 hypothetical protein [Niabella sp.]
MEKHTIITTVLRNIAVLSDLLPLILFIFFARSKKNIGLRVAFYIVVFSAFINFFVLSNRQAREYTFLIGRITTIFEYSLFSLLFFNIIVSRAFKKGIVVITILIGLYLLYDLFSTANNSFDSVPSGITSLTFLIYCIFYLFERVSDPTSLFLYSSPVFWVVVALIIYFAGTFFPFIYAQSHMKEDQFISEYDLIHDTLYIIKNLLFGFAMLIKDTTIKSPSSITKKK